MKNRNGKGTGKEASADRGPKPARDFVLSVENVARPSVEGVALSRNPANKKIALQSLARNLRLDKPDRLENSYRKVDNLPRKPCHSLPGVASVLKLRVQHGLNPKATQLKPEDIVDMRLCKKPDESGFMDRLYQGS